MPRTKRVFVPPEDFSRAALVREHIERANDLSGRTQTWSNRMRYRFDNALSRGTAPVLGLLAAVSFLIILMAAFIVTIFHAAFVSDSERGFLEIFWQTSMRALDPGTMVADEGWGIRLLSLAVTLCGILIVSTLIGAIAAGLEVRLEDLRKGKSLVAEHDHTLILGWTDRGFVVIEQLALVNSMKEQPSNIVVLSDEPKVQLEDEIRQRVDLRGVRLAVRRGDSSSALDLARVNVQGARSIVVLGDDAPGDSQVITTILAVRSRRDGMPIIPIVADLTEGDTQTALARGFSGQINTVMASRIVARLAAFSLREPGLSQVMLELMNFAGSEVYIQHVPGATGQRYAELINAFDNATIIGILSQTGEVELNPPPDKVIEPGCRPIVLAKSPREARLGRPAEPCERSGTDSLTPRYNRNEHVLVLGWSPLGASMLEELDKFVSPTSTATVLFDERILPTDEVEVPNTLNLQVSAIGSRNTTGDVGELIASHEFSSIVILGYSGQLDSRRADSGTLLSLLLITEELARSARSSRPSVVVELLDEAHVELAALSGADDYVVSGALASQVMSQLAENPERQEVFEHLYAPKRATVVFRSAERLGLHGSVTFAEVRRACFGVGASAIGWRKSSTGELDVHLNPPTHETILLDPTDEVIAII